MRIVLMAGLVTLVASGAGAQQPAPSSAPAPDLTRAIYMSAADAAAAVAATVGKQGTAPNGSTRVFQLLPYTVNIEHRIAVLQGAAIHDKEAELFYIIDGSATLITGGRVVDATRNGDNVNGKSIEGGTAQKVGKGDFVMVPQGVPHWFTDIQGSLTQMSLHLPIAATK
jgi:mannose-6-phosphate isomerase-like protein (cupin superfamily)